MKRRKSKQPKRYNKKESNPSKEELEWMGKVAQLSCIVTSQAGVQVHHITERGRRLGNFYVLPVMPEVHAKISVFPFAEQKRMCKRVWQILGREWVEPPTKVVERPKKPRKRQRYVKSEPKEFVRYEGVLIGG